MYRNTLWRQDSETLHKETVLLRITCTETCATKWSQSAIYVKKKLVLLVECTKAMGNTRSIVRKTRVEPSRKRLWATQSCFLGFYTRREETWCVHAERIILKEDRVNELSKKQKQKMDTETTTPLKRSLCAETTFSAVNNKYKELHQQNIIPLLLIAGYSTLSIWDKSSNGIVCIFTLRVGIVTLKKNHVGITEGSVPCAHCQSGRIGEPGSWLAEWVCWWQTTGRFYVFIYLSWLRRRCGWICFVPTGCFQSHTNKQTHIFYTSVFLYLSTCMSVSHHLHLPSPSSPSPFPSPFTSTSSPLDLDAQSCM